jgi:hypothetical protein
MMHRRIAVFFLVLAGFAEGWAQHSGLTWFPERAGFTPPMASAEEARLGLTQHLGESPLLLQIGGSPDVLSIPLGSDSVRWGADFVVLALSHEFKGVLFKIAAADGIFGMHVSWRMSERWNFRFRAMHRSAHLVDGNYDADAGRWSDGREPFNFTRNYGEITGLFEPCRGDAGPAIRLYGGLSASIWTRPRTINAVGGSFGAEIRPSPASGLYLAWSLSVAGIPAAAGTNSVECGYRIGSPAGRGARLFLSYRSGPDVMGAFYDLRKQYAGVGLAFDGL